MLSIILTGALLPGLLLTSSFFSFLSLFGSSPAVDFKQTQFSEEFVAQAEKLLEQKESSMDSPISELAFLMPTPSESPSSEGSSITPSVKAGTAVAVVPSVTSVPTKPPAVDTPPSSFDSVYQEAGAKYGIPWEILYGLHITETGGRDGMIMNGSGSGARGPMQFMPGTWGAYGVDGNGDGVADIDNAVDAIHGAANYLALHGSLDNGLRSYGGNMPRTLALAQSRGYTP